MASRGLVNRSGKSRSQFLRLSKVREKDFLMLTPEGEERSVKLDSYSQRDNVTPTEFAKTFFSPIVGGASIEAIEAESPYIRVHGLCDDGGTFSLRKVSARYPRGAASERTPYEEKIRMRRGSQDARSVVRGMGKTVVQHDVAHNRTTQYLFLIPEGADPAQQAEVPADQIHDRLKALYRQHYRAGARMTFTMTSTPEGEDPFCETHLLTPTVPHEHQPGSNSNMVLGRPQTPDEFDAYIDRARAGELNAQEDRLVEALENIVRTGGQWKAVPVHRLVFSNSVRNHVKDKPTGKIGKNIREDLAFARTLHAEGAVDVGWKSGNKIDNTPGFARHSILGRIGALHDCYTPMEVVEAKDSYLQLPRVEDAVMAAPESFAVSGLKLDSDSVADWHNGQTHSVEPLLDLVVPGAQANAEAAASTAGNNGRAAADQQQQAGPPAQDDATASQPSVLDEGVTDEYDGVTVPESGFAEEHAPF